MSSPIMISVIEGGGISPHDLRMAEEVGYELARQEAVVVCGGLKGVMETVCRGAKSANGVTIGILPNSNPNEANRWVDYPVCTELGDALGEGIPVIGLSSWELARNGHPDNSITRATLL